MEHQDIRNMTVDTIGKDILGALVTEIRLMPKAWDQLSKSKQDDVIERLRKRVEANNVKMAVHLLAADGRTVVAGSLDQITIKDGVKAVVKFGQGAPNLHELFEVAGKEVLVVVANASDHTGGMDEVQGEADQRAMDLGHEYHDQVGPSAEELDEAYEDGYQAAADGKDKADAPVVRHELIAQWGRGWNDWHEQNPADDGSDNEKKAA